MIGMSIWHELNLNPLGKRIGDCAVRAIASALDIDWYQAYALLCTEGYKQCDLPNSDSVWGNVLRQHGFKRYIVPNTCSDCYNVIDFAYDHSDNNIYVLGFGGHVAVLKNGFLLDSWDSSMELPIFYWTKEK